MIVAKVAIGILLVVTCCWLPQDYGHLKQKLELTDKAAKVRLRQDVVMHDFRRNGMQHSFEVPHWAQPLRGQVAFQEDGMFELTLAMRESIPHEVTGLVSIEVVFDTMRGRNMVLVFSPCGIAFESSPIVMPGDAALLLAKPDGKWELIASVEVSAEKNELRFRGTLPGYEAKKGAFAVFVSYASDKVVGLAGERIGAGEMWEISLFGYLPEEEPIAFSFVEPARPSKRAQLK
jgi:hypothetical protein